jgi:hypothetical protein
MGFVCPLQPPETTLRLSLQFPVPALDLCSPAAAFHSHAASVGFAPSCLSRLELRASSAGLRLGSAHPEVGAFYWTVLAPDIVNPGREEQGSVSV